MTKRRPTEDGTIERVTACRARPDTLHPLDGQRRIQRGPRLVTRHSSVPETGSGGFPPGCPKSQE